MYLPCMLINPSSICCLRFANHQLPHLELPCAQLANRLKYYMKESGQDCIFILSITLIWKTTYHSGPYTFKINCTLKKMNGLREFINLYYMSTEICFQDNTFQTVCSHLILCYYYYLFWFKYRYKSFSFIY